jgi:hypothetical protein
MHSDERNYSKHLALLALLFLSVGAIALVSYTASAQQQQRLQVRPAATGINPTPIHKFGLRRLMANALAAQRL